MGVEDAEERNERAGGMGNRRMASKQVMEFVWGAIRCVQVSRMKDVKQMKRGV